MRTKETPIWGLGLMCAPERVRNALLRATLLTSILIMPVSAIAKPMLGDGRSPIDQYWKSCPQRASADSGNLNSLIECGERTFAFADRELNRMFHEKMHGLPRARSRALLNSQRGWLASRDRRAEACASPWTPEGHEYPLQFAMCQAGLTVDRVTVIRRWK